MTTTAASKPLLGRCRDCDFALFATEEDVRQVEEFAEMRQPGIAYRLPDRRTFARCQNHHKVFFLRPIKGTYSEVHKCDSRCLNARGNDCTCSCGGINHGRGHVATLMPAGEEKPERHLGEVGKHIKGQAKLTEKKKIGFPGDSLILHVFKTLDGTATIKWFCPKPFDPEFEVGEIITFRAKVKKHDDHERFGKATIVTYLEEVK